MLSKENRHLQYCLGNVMPVVVYILRDPPRLGNNCARPHDAIVKQPEWAAIAILHGQSRRDVSWDGSDDENFTRPIWLGYSLTRLAQAPLVCLQKVVDIIFGAAGAEGLGKITIDEEFASRGQKLERIASTADGSTSSVTSPRSTEPSQTELGDKRQSCSVNILPFVRLFVLFFFFFFLITFIVRILST